LFNTESLGLLWALRLSIFFKVHTHSTIHWILKFFLLTSCWMDRCNQIHLWPWHSLLKGWAALIHVIFIS
jgi:hypothetical protein